MIGFESRKELFLPPNAEITVGAKQKVKGGSAVMAKIKKSTDEDQ